MPNRRDHSQSVVSKQKNNKGKGILKHQQDFHSLSLITNQENNKWPGTSKQQNDNNWTKQQQEFLSPLYKQKQENRSQRKETLFFEPEQEGQQRRRSQSVALNRGKRSASKESNLINRKRRKFN